MKTIIKNRFRVADLPEDTQVTISFGGGSEGISFWTLLNGSPLRELLEKQEAFEQEAQIRSGK